MGEHTTITDVPGVLVGQMENPDAITGCTVVLCKDGAVAGVDQRGGAPGTRETDLLGPMHLVQEVETAMREFRAERKDLIDRAKPRL